MGVCASSNAALFAKLYAIDETVVLGEGTFAQVFSGTYRRTGDAVVIKRIDKNAANDEGLGRFWDDEAAMLQACTPHPHIIELLHVYESPTHVFLVMELAQGGELFEALISEGAYSEWDAKRFTRDLLDALTRIHSEHIVHRDIKPENLLLTSKDPRIARIKLGDFGTAMPVNGTSFMSCMQLTWAYCAPEVLREMLAMPSRDTSTGRTSETVPIKPKLPNPSSTPKSDVWSVGIVLYVLLSGIHPFDPDGRQTKDQIISNILFGKYSLTEPALWETEISEQAKSLLRSLLNPDPAQRPTAKEALDHPWFHDATTPRLALQVSISKGLGAYQLSMQKKFRTSVLVAMAAQSLRRSLYRIRNSKTGSQGRSSSVTSLEIPSDGGGEEPASSPISFDTIPEAPSPPVTPSAASRLFGRAVYPDRPSHDDKQSEKQSIDLIDEFDGEHANATRPPRLVD